MVVSAWVLAGNRIHTHLRSRRKLLEGLFTQVLVGLREPIRDVEAPKEAINNYDLVGQGEDLVFLEPSVG